MMMERRVPNELVDCILDNLYLDTATLLNCVLVGKAWVRSSQRGIFREIILNLPFRDQDAYLEAIRRLDALFSEKPYLASYVRSLELRWFAQFDRYDWLQLVYNATASLVQRLSNVKKLKFHRVEWKPLSPLLKAALNKICEASVTQFCAMVFYVPTFVEFASLLTRMRNLKVLDVDLRCNDQIVPNSLSELEIEEASLPPRNMATLQYFGTNLRELTLYGCPAGNQALNVAHLPNLRCLSLLHVYQTETHSPVPWIQALFEPLLNLDGNLCPLQRLAIGLVIGHPQSNSLQPHQWYPWAAVDMLLGKPEFASLKTVELKLARGILEEVPGISKVLSERLPLLEGLGKLVVQIADVDVDD
ncbi:hypothetical protein BT96DRAFT_995413 [Gymnopus androsaceus JB14]|uniref:F-box domain-containing protein n=1 Tax=Gymnopus androsaceus JB14 TaxID=1447944 RepID=A0A6A4HIQ4_9AGAR|nr:hypothetical protein BT96DRAFT_995413 [Gymnopus androsaceus JB14]